MRKDKRTVSVALVSFLALSMFAIASAAPVVTENPITAFLDALNDIKNQLNKGPQVLTRTETVTFLAGTPAGPFYELVQIRIDPDKAADFKVTLITFDGDWTTESGDILAVGEAHGYGGTVLSWHPIYVIDSDLNNYHWETAFTARWMTIHIQLGDTLANDITICYSYTVTTDAGATIVEAITPPPTPS